MEMEYNTLSNNCSKFSEIEDEKIVNTHVINVSLNSDVKGLIDEIMYLFVSSANKNKSKLINIENNTMNSNNKENNTGNNTSNNVKIILKGIKSAIDKVVLITEVIKSRVKGIHQVLDIGCLNNDENIYNDDYINKIIPKISVTLTNFEPKYKEFGYRAPYSMSDLYKLNTVVSKPVLKLNSNNNSKNDCKNYNHSQGNDKAKNMIINSNLKNNTYKLKDGGNYNDIDHQYDDNDFLDNQQTNIENKYNKINFHYKILKNSLDTRISNIKTAIICFDSKLDQKIKYQSSLSKENEFEQQNELKMKFQNKSNILERNFFKKLKIFGMRISCIFNNSFSSNLIKSLFLELSDLLKTNLLFFENCENNLDNRFLNLKNIEKNEFYDIDRVFRKLSKKIRKNFKNINDKLLFYQRKSESFLSINIKKYIKR